MKPKDKYTLIEEIQSAVALYCCDHDDQDFEITLSVRVRSGWANVEETYWGREEGGLTMLKPGKRQLRDITDQELQVIVEMSHHYGCKDFWGNPVITDIDRNMFNNTIVIDYEQTRIKDGEKSLTVMFFEYNSLTYHVDYRYPYARSTKPKSITEDPKMLLWLLNQDFDLLSVLPEKPTAIYMSQSYKTMGFLVGHGHCGYFKMDTMKFFGPDEREEANEYQDERKQEKDYVHVFQVIDANERDRDFRLKDKHYQRMEHCIGLDGANVKDDLYKAYRNSVAYNECVAEWEDLVRNGYARRSGEVGHSIFYSVTRKGFEAIARRNGIRIRYEIEINP